MGRHKKVVLDQLTIDSNNAIKAGLSYGKYMALKKHTNVQSAHKPDPDFDGYKHTCQYCGKDYVIFHRRKSKFCSDSCRNAYQYHKKTCPICGKEFVAESYRNKYCSEFCAKVGNGQRVKEYQERKKEAMA